MIGTLRRHSNVLWYIIIAAVIVSFVIYFSPTSKMGGASREMDFGTVYGRKITRAESVTAQKETELLFFVNRHRWPTSFNEEFEQEMRRRLFLIESLNKSSIRADDTAVARQIRAYFPKREGAGFEETEYKRFVKGELEPNRISEAEFFEFVRHNIGQMHLIAVMGMPGRLAAPRGAEAMFSRATQAVDAEAAFFSRSNYLDSVKMDPTAITNYFSQRIESYAIPERKQLAYVYFAATNYLAEADKILAGITNLDSEIDSEYIKRGTNSFMDGTNVLTAAAAKAKIKEDLRKDKERAASRKAANEFAGKLYRMKPVSPDNLAVMAATNGLAALETKPFSENEGPSEIESSEIISSMAWGLDATNRPFSTPVPGIDGTYVLAFKKILPREYPPFAALKTKVEDDYRRAQAQELTLQAGMAFSKAVTNGLAQGKSFHDICTNASVTPISVFAISHQTTEAPAIENRVDLSSFKDVALSTPAGKASPYRSTREGGFVVYVSKVIPPNDAKIHDDFPKFVEDYRDEQQNVAYTEWFQHEFVKSGLAEMKQKPRAAK